MTITITLEIVERYTGEIEGFVQNPETRHSHSLPDVADVPPPYSMLSVCTVLLLEKFIRRTSQGFALLR